ncbi:trypsin-like serine peptidase [Mycobacterium shimoidei]|uniref:trypsin-like serine peptidase n=1 Tax=Mycobacterium shimoidei TaxID=29313 RepID=UPI0008489DC1|nr:trypsin-like peptidase domain-containing protein [Mycobacterium shimoidei]MCV7257046.1 trypsin-like peptidase domain-containing protein [Mycobacterium shimoidei]ODR07421.1 trypsin [Mycobacterium shimoidei]ORW77100.1 trypsin [Mycobacterium shimoidei]
MRIVTTATGLLAGLTLALTGCEHPPNTLDASPTISPSQRHVTDIAVQGPAAPVPPDPRVGAIFLGAGDLHTCTGSVLHSAGGDLVLTAAHCLAAGINTTFVPGFSGAAAAPDVWTVDAAYFDPRWLANRDPHADYAIARVSRPEGGTIEAAAGAGVALGTAPKAGTQIRVVGYPARVGGGPVGCQAGTNVTEDGYPALPCSGLVDGTSGAPWLIGSTVSGVIGGLDGGGCDDNVSYSAPFDEHIAALLARAEAGGPGDRAPNALSGQC